ncbi:MAG: TRAM domain-containing protein [Candidatus Aenigmarchaeota archaeon]|nr:TRAM domain-containing protein [Candidatus Aenigmarchaeota archaeon]
MRDHILKRIQEDRQRSQQKYRPRETFINPIKVGEEYDVEITRLGREGDGMATVKRCLVFVPNTKIGDKVKIKINGVRGRTAMGEIIESETLTIGEVEKIEVITELKKQAEQQGLKVVGGAE